MMRALVALVALAACDGGSRAPRIAATAPAPIRPATPADRIVALLPDGAQVVVEIDLARLRANPVVGAVAKRALAELGDDARVPGLPAAPIASPLATADAIVFAAWGVGTAQAATIAVVATAGEVDGATAVAPGLVALGAADWIAQLQARAALGPGVVAASELVALRDHAMPPLATGAILRATVRLSFDARVAFARQLGVDAPPARLSAWGDIADDLAIVVDADAADPGERVPALAARRLEATMRAALAGLASVPAVRAAGVAPDVAGARVSAHGSWVRAVITVDPRPLARAAERVAALIGAPS